MAFNMDPKKCPMPTQDPNVRNKDFEAHKYEETCNLFKKEAE